MKYLLSLKGGVILFGMVAFLSMSFQVNAVRPPSKTPSIKKTFNKVTKPSNKPLRNNFSGGRSIKGKAGKSINSYDPPKSGLSGPVQRATLGLGAAAGIKAKKTPGKISSLQSSKGKRFDKEKIGNKSMLTPIFNRHASKPRLVKASSGGGFPPRSILKN